MPTVADHYRDVLSDVYSWMLGGFDAAVGRNARFFEENAIVPHVSGRALDLGCGCGFQTIPLARAGFDVTAIDLDRGLLDELEQHRGSLPVAAIQDDMRSFEAHLTAPAELVVCMTDTLLHLDSGSEVAGLVDGIHAALEPDGRFVATFRDLSSELFELDRFLPVRSDDDTILSCFLEYEARHVKVHDVLYTRGESGWQLAKGYYRKLRLAGDDFLQILASAGFRLERADTANGLVTVIARK